MARLRYPTGVRPLLIDETARRRRVEARVVTLLEASGFAEVVLPVIDYAEPYAAAGGADPRQAYRFIDRDGELVAIRSDFTPLVARALAPSLAEAELPLRVFYRGDVIRYEPSRLGANREMFQIGAEIIGDAGVESDIAVLRLVSRMLRELGIEPLIVYGDERAPSVVPERLEAIAAAAIPGCVPHLDDEPTGRYYTGLRFRAYDASRRVVIAQGGRYDSLYERFGCAAPAVGFTITVDEVR
ncbi:MAG TPA: ATP phosphoribosyltransferase regulatory subunit [Thermoanaerobaculia bacterium]|nr:ATP phosphoribosyltransferase regulatory subunit [Thermoanaerobaculia bacterium]